MLSNEVKPIRHLAILGIAKDVEKTIESDYKKIQKVFANLSEKITWFIVESNSSDMSIDKLTALQNVYENFQFKTLGKMSGSVPRFVHMAKSRNEYLTELRTNSKYESVDYVAIVDLNNLNNKLKIESVRSCFKRDDWDVCTANQNGPYYDIWALRHSLWSPNDCWQAHKFLREKGVSPEKALFSAVQSRMLRIPREADWIKVDSAFGGLAIYKRWTLDEGSYVAKSESGQSVCEHVSLHDSINKRGGRIFINPMMINTNYTDHSRHTRQLSKLLRISKYPIKYLKALVK